MRRALLLTGEGTEGTGEVGACQNRVKNPYADQHGSIATLLAVSIVYYMLFINYLHSVKAPKNSVRIFIHLWKVIFIVENQPYLECFSPLPSDLRGF